MNTKNSSDKPSLLDKKAKFFGEKLWTAFALLVIVLAYAYVAQVDRANELSGLTDLTPAEENES